MMVNKLVLTGSLSLIPLVVSLCTWSVYSHCYFELEDGSRVDAHPIYGVSKRRIGKSMLEKTYDLTRLPEAQRRAVCRKLLAQVGKPYDWQWIIGYPFNRNWQDDDSWVCFELAAYALNGSIAVDKKLHRVTGRQLSKALDGWVDA